MNVKQLIEVLRQFDPELPVVAIHRDNEVFEIDSDVDPIDVVYLQDNGDHNYELVDTDYCEVDEDMIKAVLVC